MNALRWWAAITGAALQALALWWLWHYASAGPAMLAHLLGGAAWGYGIARLHPFSSGQAWALATFSALIFPVAGLAASLALLAIVRRPSREHTDKRYLVWKDQPQADLPGALPAGSAGQSIVAILQSPRTQLRRNAVLALRELDPQLAIPLLRKGLQDSDEQVRIYAQNILSGMLERFEGGIKELQQQLRANPAAALAARRLAEQFFELVYLDVAGDDESAAHYLVQALALLDRAAAAAPDDREIPLLGLKYALRARDAGAARRWCERITPEQLESQHVLPWRMELAFLEADWTALRVLFAIFARGRYFNPRLDEVARMWGAGTVTAK